LSFAAFGDSSALGLTSGTAGVERTAKRRHAHCKFIVVAPATQFFSEIPSLYEIHVCLRNSRLCKITAGQKNDVLILKSRSQIALLL
jgi:hypothetical protein